MRELNYAFSAEIRLQKDVYGDIVRDLLKRLSKFLVAMKFDDLR
jgi:hypothetical protein